MWRAHGRLGDAYGDALPAELAASVLRREPVMLQTDGDGSTRFRFYADRTYYVDLTADHVEEIRILGPANNLTVCGCAVTLIPGGAAVIGDHCFSKEGLRELAAGVSAHVSA